MSTSESDLCPGYRANHFAEAGVCCCGLYWEVVMPLHDCRGKRLPNYALERWMKRNREELARGVDTRRAAREFDTEHKKNVSGLTSRQLRALNQIARANPRKAGTVER